MDRLKLYFDEYFSDTSKPTARNLFLLILSILTLDTFRSVRFAHRHVLSRISDTSLNAYYYTLKSETWDHSAWSDVTVRKVLKVIPSDLSSQPLFLSIDDTMIEKAGKHFEFSSKLFDHAAHNGSNYLNGHCMVSILLSFPVWKEGQIHYLSVPLAYRLWDKEKSKIALAAEMVQKAMGVLGAKRQIFLLCDSWYPKKEVVQLAEDYKNLDIICNVRTDTVLYDLPPEKTGKRGRPRKKGARLDFRTIPLSDSKSSDWKIGVRPVITNLWKNRTVYAIVTCPKDRESGHRLFLCTKNPEEIQLDFQKCANSSIREYGKENILYLPLACYSLRWNIETSYYEEKTFWSLSNYRVRTGRGIERLVNLLSISYSAMTLLPYSDELFSRYQSASAQDTRFEIGQQIQGTFILVGFLEKLEITKKTTTLINLVEKYILSGLSMRQNL